MAGIIAGRDAAGTRRRLRSTRRALRRHRPGRAARQREGRAPPTARSTSPRSSPASTGSSSTADNGLNIRVINLPSAPTRPRTTRSTRWPSRSRTPGSTASSWSPRAATTATTDTLADPAPTPTSSPSAPTTPGNERHADDVVPDSPAGGMNDGTSTSSRRASGARPARARRLLRRGHPYALAGTRFVRRPAPRRPPRSSAARPPCCCRGAQATPDQVKRQLMTSGPVPSRAPATSTGGSEASSTVLRVTDEHADRQQPSPPFPPIRDRHGITWDLSARHALRQ